VRIRIFEAVVGSKRDVEVPANIFNSHQSVCHEGSAFQVQDYENENGNWGWAPVTSDYEAIEMVSSARERKRNAAKISSPMPSTPTAKSTGLFDDGIADGIA